MLDFFRSVAQSIPSTSPSPTIAPDPDTVSIEPQQGTARDMLQDRAGIIVLREDLDFYVIPPRPDISQPDMIEVKRAAGKALLTQDGIFSGLRRSEEVGTTEQHLIEMLTAGYVIVSVFSAIAANPFSSVVSTTMIDGGIEPANQTRLLSAALRLPDCEPISKGM